ncbi:hypothetical protein [Rappaport israeli]|uniref:hypothetical protein n=1 Tax=Rappaport israeli TaxID=1839807 RepID=UPI000931503F|nr:hypothetical protein [Rappaport israeli]
MNTENTIYIAFYKGKARKNDPIKVKLAHMMDFLIRVITRSPYSHCEVAIPDTTRKGVYHCYSSSIRDKGVRDKWMYLPNYRWDLVKVDADAAKIRERFARTQKAGYDYAGPFSFLLPVIHHNPKKWFCSELCAWLINLPNSRRYSPASLHKHLTTGAKHA